MFITLNFSWTVCRKKQKVGFFQSSFGSCVAVCVCVCSYISTHVFHHPTHELGIVLQPSTVYACAGAGKRGDGGERGAPGAADGPQRAGGDAAQAGDAQGGAGAADQRDETAVL